MIGRWRGLTRAQAASERAGTLPLGFLHGSDAQRVLTNYQRVTRLSLGTRPMSIAGPEGNPRANSLIENLTLGTRFGGRLATHRGRSLSSMAMPAHAPTRSFGLRGWVIAQHAGAGRAI